MPFTGGSLADYQSYMDQQGSQNPTHSYSQYGAGAYTPYRTQDTMIGNPPYYDYIREQQMRGLNSRLAQQGMTFSGKAIKQQNRLAQQLASGNYQDQWNRLSQMAGYGTGTLSDLGSAGAAAAAGAGTNYMQGGMMQGSAYADRANMWSGVGQDLASMYGYGRY